MQLLQLPTDVLWSIFAHAEWRDLLRCHLVCKYLRGILQDSVLLQYKVELGTAGYIDGPPSSTSVASRLNELKRQQLVWEDMVFSRRDAIEGPGPWPAYDLQKGVLTRCINYAIDQRVSTTIEFIKLPSPFPSSSDHSKWSFDCPDILVKDFTTDPHLDLIVLAEEVGPKVAGEFGHIAVPLAAANLSTCRLHFRTMSTNEVHPLSREAFLSFGTDMGLLEISGLVLRGHLVACITKRRRQTEGISCQLNIWDWTTGQRLKTIRTAGTSTLVFLDDTSFLLGINDFATHRWALEVHTIPLLRSSSSRHVAFLMPPIVPSQNNSVASYMLRADPNTPSTTCLPHVTPVIAPEMEPFEANPKELLVSLAFVAFSQSRNDQLLMYRFFVFFHAAALQSLASRKLSETDDNPPSPPSPPPSPSNPPSPSDPSSSVLNVPWEEWGPINTRWCRDIPINRFVCNIHGQRYATFKNPGAHPTLSILDFNPHTINRHPNDPSPDPSKVQSGNMKASNIIAIPQLFQHPIESCLPYRETIVGVPDGLGEDVALMMDKDRILLFPGDTEDLKFEVFTV